MPTLFPSPIHSLTSPHSHSACPALVPPRADCPAVGRTRCASCAATAAMRSTLQRGLQRAAHAPCQAARAPASSRTVLAKHCFFPPLLFSLFITTHLVLWYCHVMLLFKCVCKTQIQKHKHKINQSINPPTTREKSHSHTNTHTHSHKHTHSHTYTHTHTLTHSHKHTYTHSLTHSLTPSLTHSLTLAFLPSFLPNPSPLVLASPSLTTHRCLPRRASMPPPSPPRAPASSRPTRPPSTEAIPSPPGSRVAPRSPSLSVQQQASHPLAAT